MSTLDFFVSILKMLSALAVVIGIMLATVWVIRKFMGRTGQDAAEGQAIRILSTRSLGPKSNLMLIDVLGQTILIGVTAGQISMITAVTDEDALDRLQALQADDRANRSVLDPIALYKKKLRTLSLVGSPQNRK